MPIKSFPIYLLSIRGNHQGQGKQRPWKIRKDVIVFYVSTKVIWTKENKMNIVRKPLYFSSLSRLVCCALLYWCLLLSAIISVCTLLPKNVDNILHNFKLPRQLSLSILSYNTESFRFTIHNLFRFKMPKNMSNQLGFSLVKSSLWPNSSKNSGLLIHFIKPFDFHSSLITHL